MHIKLSGYDARLVCHSLVLMLLITIVTGCSSQQPVSQQQANAQPAAKQSSLELNPLRWPWNPMEWDTYAFRDKYNFKVGDMWVIKPPRQFNPSQVVVVRQLGSIPDQPQPKPPVAELYEAYVVKKEAQMAASMPTTKPARKVTQMLVIDLASSNAILRDSDGKEYPSQVDPALTRQLIDLTTKRQWLIQKKTKLKNVAADQWAYRSVFQEVSDEYKPVRRNWK
ncbi:MAG TPA: hypothetical protein DER01_16380, partial [Phycisphaerales bacterium]|nr:hypothetical protein [Phycisphaerales bacterium]